MHLDQKTPVNDYVTVQLATELRSQARKNSAGLPLEILVNILKHVGPSLEDFTEVQTENVSKSAVLTEEEERSRLILCQAVKYGIRFSTNDLLSSTAISEVLEILCSAIRAHQKHTPILSELVFALAYLLEADNNNSLNFDFAFASTIEVINSNELNPTARNFLSRVVHFEQDAAAASSFHLISENRFSNLRNVQGSGPTLTRTLTQSRIQSKRSTSEKLTLTPINLTDTLRQGIKGNFETGYTVETLPAVAEDAAGNDRSFWRGTLSEVQNLLNLARGGIRIKLGDKDRYLVEKYFGHFLENGYVCFGDYGDTMVKIAEIFGIISKTQVLSDQAKCKLFKSIDPDHSEIKKYISGHNIPQEKVLILRRWALSAIYNCCLRNISTLDENDGSSVVKKHLKSLDSQTQLLAWKIIFLSRSDENFFDLFFNALEIISLRAGVDVEQQLGYISQQVKDEFRCAILFTPVVISQLTSIVSMENFPILTRTTCAEIVNAALSKLEKLGLAPSDLGKYADILEIPTEGSQTRDEHLLAEVLTGILFTFQNVDCQCPASLHEVLVDNLEHLPVRSACLTILTLGKISDSGTRVSKLGRLPIWLSSDLVVVTHADHTIEFEKYSEEIDNGALHFISATVANILLKFVQVGRGSCNTFLSSGTIRQMLGVLRDSWDKQTRIRIAECLYFYSLHPDHLSVKDLGEVKAFLNDTVLDVQVYSKLIFVTGCLSLAKKDQARICVSFFQSVCSIYSTSAMVLDTRDFTQELNSNILELVNVETRKCLKLEETGFDLLNYILLHEANGEYQELALEIIHRITSKGNSKLPESTIKIIENMLDLLHPSPLMAEIVVSVVRNQQPVSEPTLNLISDQLFSSDRLDIRAASLELLEMANINQDLPDKFFTILEFEELAKSCRASIDGLKSLNRLVKDGGRITRNVFDSLGYLLRTNTFIDPVLELLKCVAEVNQIFPSETVEIMIESFKRIRRSDAILMYSQIFRILLRNYQSIPKSIWEVYGKKFCQNVKQTNLFEEFSSAFLIGIRLGFPVKEQIRKEFLQTIESEVILKPECIRCCIAMISTDDGSMSDAPILDEKMLESVRSVLLRALTTGNAVLGPLAVQGFEVLSTRTDWAYTDDERAILLTQLNNSKLDKLRERIFILLEKSKHELNTEQRCIFDLAKIDETNFNSVDHDFKPSNYMNILERLDGGTIPEAAFTQLGAVIDNDAPDLNFLKSRILHRVLNKSQPPLPERFVNKVVNFYARANQVQMKTLCLNVMHVYTEATKKLNQNALNICFQHFDECKSIINLLNEDCLSPDQVLLLKIHKQHSRKSLGNGEIEQILDGFLTLLNSEDSAVFVDQTLIQNLVNFSKEASAEIQTSVSVVLATLYLRSLVPSSEKGIIMTNLYFTITTWLPNKRKISEQIPENVLIAFHNLLTRDALSLININVTELAEALSSLIVRESHPILLESILEIFNRYPEEARPNQELMLQLETLLSSEDHLLRGLSFKCLNYLWLNRGAWRSQKFEKTCFSLSQKLNLAKKQDMSKFTSEDFSLMSTIMPLEYLDLEQLKPLPRDQWIAHLIISDIAERFCLNQVQALELKQVWDEVALKFKAQSESEDDVIPPVEPLSAGLGRRLFSFWVGNAAEAEPKPKSTAQNILQRISYLSYLYPSSFTALSDTLAAMNSINNEEKAREIVNQGTPKWQENLQTAQCTEILNSKSNHLNLNPTHITNLARRMIRVFTCNEVVTLASKLEGISNVSELEDLISFCEAHKIERPSDHLPRNKKSVTVTELGNYLNTAVLLKSFGINQGLIGFKLKCHLDSLLSSGFKFETLNQIAQHPKVQTSKSQFLMNVIRLLVDYNAQPDICERIIGIIDARNSEEWIYETNQIILESLYPADAGTQKSLQEILDETAANNPIMGDWLKQKEIKEKVLQIYDSEITKSVSEIKAWAKYIKKQSIDLKTNIVDAMIFISNAIRHKLGFKLNSVQIQSCVTTFLLSDRANLGHLQQVVTGTGKSAIIAVVAILHCLTGKSVDICTSSSVLADRDAKKFQSLYSLFGLTTATNTSSVNYTKGPKACYKADIVYGDVANFQFDILLHEYSRLKTRGERKFSVILVDEVDSMLIDNNSKVAKLASSMPGLDCFQIIYHLLWNELTTIKNRVATWNGKTYLVSGKAKFVDGRFQVELLNETTGDVTVVKDVEELLQASPEIGSMFLQEITVTCSQFLTDHLTKYITDQLRSGQIPIPKHFRSLTELQIPKWVENCQIASWYAQDVQYIVHEGKIKPVNYDSTGTVESFTNWSDGLHQFLQIKHNLKVTSETLTSNFLSNIDFFNRYQGRLFGFTGTLGSDSAKQMLADVFKLDFFYLPDQFKKRHVSLPPVLAATRNEWILQVIECARLEIAKKRGVLLICETIEMVRMFVKKLRKLCRNSLVKEYTQNDMGQEKLVDRIFPGEIIVATNLAGRGTDIKSDDIERYGGLHVLLSFLPPNLRLDDQNKGRTSRQGKSGSSQIIVCLEDVMENKLTAESLTRVRDEQEAALLEQIRGSSLRMCQIKGRIFQRFCELLEKLRTDIRSSESTFVTRTMDKVVDHTASNYEEALISCTEEQWAILLKSVDHGIISIDSAEEAYTEFETQIMEKFKAGTLLNSPFYYISLANECFINDSSQNKNLTTAEEYFQKAFELDSQFASPANYGKAACMIKRNCPENYKELAIVEYGKVLPIVSHEVAQLQTMYALLMNRTALNQGSDLAQQLIFKQDILATYASSIEQSIQKLEASLRLMSLTGNRNEKKTEFFKLTSDDCLQKLDEFQAQRSGYLNFDLEFNHLTAHCNDMKRKDQALEVIQFAKTPSIEIHCRDFKSELLTSVLNPDITESNLSKDEALKALNLKQRWTHYFKRLLTRPIRIEITIHHSVPESRTEVLPICDSFDIARVAIKNTPAGETASYTMIFREFNSKLARKFDRVGLNLGMFELNSNTASELLLQSESASIELDVIGTFETLQNIASNYIQQSIEMAHTDIQQKTRTLTRLSPVVPLSENSKLIKISGLNKETASRICLENPNCIFSFELIEVNKVTLGRFITALPRPLISSVTFRAPVKLTREVVLYLRGAKIDFSVIFRKLTLESAENLAQNATSYPENMNITSTGNLADNYSIRTTGRTELDELRNRGISLLVEITENQPIPKIAIGVMLGLATVQLAIGGALIASGFGASSGLGVVTEGAADLLLVYRAYSTRNFSWGDYCSQKTVSLAVSAANAGASKLKDAGYGLKTFFQATGSEVVEQSTTQLIVNGKTVAASVVESGASLKNLAWKQIGVSVGEMAVREASFNILGRVTDLTTNRILKPYIFENVEREVFQKFNENRIRFLFKKILALDKISSKKTLQNRIETILHEILSKSTAIMDQCMEGLTEAVSKFIFSNADNSDQLISWSNGLPLLQKMLSVTTDITQVVNKTGNQIKEKLEQFNRESLDNAGIFRTYCDFTGPEIIELEHFVDIDILLQHNDAQGGGAPDELRDRITIFIENLKRHFNEFTMDDVVMSRVLKSVSDRITDEILKTVDRKIISSTSKLMLSKGLESLSRNLQHYYLCNSAHNTSEYEADRQKLLELTIAKERGETLSKNDLEFMKTHSKYNSIANQINYSAKDYTVAYKQNEILLSMLKEAETGNPDFDKKIIAGTYAKGILKDGKPAGLTEICYLAKKHNLKLVITDSENPIETGSNVLVFFKGKPDKDGKEGYGSFRIRNPDSSYADIPSYDALAKITETSVDELRTSVAKAAEENPNQFVRALQAERWLSSRHPEQANTFLFKA